MGLGSLVRKMTGMSKEIVSLENEIAVNPTQTDFEKAWKQVFGYKVDDCKFEGSGDFYGEFTLKVDTPEGKVYHGGFGYHTPDPVLNPGQSKYYPGSGITWDIDANGDRFYLLNRWTNNPPDFKRIKQEQTIRAYFKTQAMFPDVTPDALLDVFPLRNDL